MKILKTNSYGPGWYIVQYGRDMEVPQTTLNAANIEIPKINGVYIDYAPELVFDSPFMHSEYDSGIISLQIDGIQKILKFNQP